MFCITAIGFFLLNIIFINHVQVGSSTVLHLRQYSTKDPNDPNDPNSSTFLPNVPVDETTIIAPLNDENTASIDDPVSEETDDLNGSASFQNEAAADFLISDCDSMNANDDQTGDIYRRNADYCASRSNLQPSEQPASRKKPEPAITSTNNPCTKPRSNWLTCGGPMIGKSALTPDQVLNCHNGPHGFIEARTIFEETYDVAQFCCGQFINTEIFYRALRCEKISDPNLDKLSLWSQEFFDAFMTNLDKVLSDPNIPNSPSKEYMNILVHGGTAEQKREFWERLRRDFRELLRTHRLPKSNPRLPGQ